MTDGDARIEATEFAALYAAGAMTDDERAAYERQIGDDEAEGAEAQAMSPVVELLAQSAAAMSPPPSVREVLLRRAAEDHPSGSSGPLPPQVWKHWPSITQSGDLFIKRKDEGTWDPTGVPGVFVRQLFVDRERNQMTALVRMAAGASYPRHVHDGPEECLVLEGDLRVGDTVLRSGDYQRAAPGSHHGIQRTEGGCLLMITSSLSDELY
jgi:anti-sigma factor ChrR (cupin superfamily)